MKQRPIFILLTFFLAISSVVIITFVFLRTQLNEKKLQALVTDSINKNFPDYDVNFGHIGLNLGTKFRYKIDKVVIKHKSSQPFFSNLVLENVSLKFPLFFLVGKQDIDVTIERVKLQEVDFSTWRKNNYIISNFDKNALRIPRIVADNRINLTINSVDFENPLSRPAVPFEIRALKHLVMKDLSFNGHTTFEISTTVGLLGENENEKSEFEMFGIGYFNLGQFFNTNILDYKVLFEVKSVNNPIYAWLTNHRLQMLSDKRGPFTNWNIHGTALEGSGLAELFADSVSLRDIDLTLNAVEVARENSTLKNIFYLFSETLDVPDFSNFDAKIQGNIAFHLGVEKYSDSQWVSHLTSVWTNNQDSKVDLDLNTLSSSNAKLQYQAKVGNDLSYRKVTVDCVSLKCIQADLLAINIDFYNQILMKTENNDVTQIHQYISKWWSSLATIVDEKLTTPVKFLWRKSRWNNFEFDFLADTSMNKTMLAADKMVVKQAGKEIAKMKFSLSNTDDGVLWRQYSQFNVFPAEVATKLFSVNNLEIVGSMSGMMAMELSQNKKSLSTDLTFVDGNVQWLNFDDLYRRVLYKNPEDEINFPMLNWTQQFNKAKLFTQWDEKQKEIEFDFILPKLNAKNINLHTSAAENEFETTISFPGLSAKGKKYLQKIQSQNNLKFDFTLRDNELKLIDEIPSTETQTTKSE